MLYLIYQYFQNIYDVITYENKGCYIRITYQKRVISRTAGRESICHQTGRIQLVNRLNSVKYRNSEIMFDVSTNTLLVSPQKLIRYIYQNSRMVIFFTVEYATNVRIQENKQNKKKLLDTFVIKRGSLLLFYVSILL